jgi:hypothetical protein
MNSIELQETIVNKAGVMPAASGVNTDWDKAQLNITQYSQAENVRVHGPGFKMRPGLVRHHTTDLGTCLSLFSYKKGAAFFAQLDDGDVYEAANAPPTAASGVFGAVVVDETALNDESKGTVLPGSWSTFRDHILFSQGKIQHVIKPAEDARPTKIIFFKAADGTLIRMLESGTDITEDVVDPGSSKTSVTLSFAGGSNEDSLYICTDFPATDFFFDIESVATGTTIVMTFHFHDGDDWVAQTTGYTDGTIDFTQDGTVVATMAGRASDGTERPMVMFGRSGYWYRFHLTTNLPTTNVSFNTINYNGDFRLIENVMESTPGFIVESQVEAGSQYETYAASTISIGELAINDWIYIATHTPAWALYIDVGATPNTTGSTSLAAVETWTGAAFEALTSVEDETGGLFHSGYISWDRTSKIPQMRSFQGNKNHSYWYRIKYSHALSSDIIVSMQALYFHDINKFGRAGKVSTMWKSRGCYTFSDFDRDIYVSKINRINILNGDDYAILSPGDGRYNQVTAMLPFYNELMVFQKEEGSLGGCLTLFEGYSPETFGKLVLSTRLGSFSQQSVCIVDASTDTTRTTDVTQTQVAFISKYGIFFTDGRTINRISGPIDNIFDPEKSSYIDINPGSGHWISYDRAGNCLRLGIQTIASTTGTPDIYPVYHLEGNFWTFDVFIGQSITAFAEVSAVSGDVDSLQYLAGNDSVSTTDLIYRCVGASDYDELATGVKQGVEMVVRPEFSSGGNYLKINEFTIRTSAQADYTLTKAVYENGVLDSDEAETFTMESQDTNGLVYRERILENMQLNSQFGIKLTFVNTADPASWGTGPVIYDFVHDITNIQNID